MYQIWWMCYYLTRLLTTFGLNTSIYLGGTFKQLQNVKLEMYGKKWTEIRGTAFLVSKQEGEASSSVNHPWWQNNITEDQLCSSVAWLQILYKTVFLTRMSKTVDIIVHSCQIELTVWSVTSSEYFSVLKH